MIFAYVGVEGVDSTLPRVCRRWKDLAADRVVWRQLTLDIPQHHPDDFSKAIR
jgi:hypothetical protein